MVLEYFSGMRMNCKKWTERPGNLSQWIKTCTQEVMLHSCMFLGKNGRRGPVGCENCEKWRKSPRLAGMEITDFQMPDKTSDTIKYLRFKNLLDIMSGNPVNS